MHVMRTLGLVLLVAGLCLRNVLLLLAGLGLLAYELAGAIMGRPSIVLTDDPPPPEAEEEEHDGSDARAVPPTAAPEPTAVAPAEPAPHATSSHGSRSAGLQTTMPVADDRLPHTTEGSGERSFVHIPLYLEDAAAFDPHGLDVAFAAESSTRNAVNLPLHHGDARVEFVQFLNEGRGSCRKDHWMVQTDAAVPVREGGGASTST